jgi:hypothetical protein
VEVIIGDLTRIPKNPPWTGIAKKSGRGCCGGFEAGGKSSCCAFCVGYAHFWLRLVYLHIEFSIFGICLTFQKSGILEQLIY